MKALIIYDLTGRIWNILYGEEAVPQGLPAMFADIPEGARLERIDVTDLEHPEPVFSYLPESDIGRLQKQAGELERQLADTQLALAEQYEENLELREEVINIQLALVELYEGKEA